MAREWEIGDAPVSFFRCRSPGAPGQRKRKSTQGVSQTSKPPRDLRRGQRPTGLLPYPLTAKHFFFSTVHGAFSFLMSQKENAGCIPPAKPASPAPRRREPQFLFSKKKGGKNGSSLPLAYACLFRHNGLHGLDLTAIVASALLAHSVRQVQSAALGTGDETGGRQLPVGAAPLIASCF